MRESPRLHIYLTQPLQDLSGFVHTSSTAFLFSVYAGHLQGRAPELAALSGGSPLRIDFLLEEKERVCEHTNIT